MRQNNNHDVYNTIFAIDNYKKAYTRCRLRNGYMQSVDMIVALLPLYIIINVQTTDLVNITLGAFAATLSLFAYYRILYHWDKISSTFRAFKIRNKYIYINSFTTTNIDQFVLEIIKTNSKI